MSSSLYKYVPIDQLKGILIDRKIRFTQPGAFNDPFELVPRLLVPKGAVPQGHRDYRFSLSAPRRPIDIDTKGDEDRCNDHHSRELRRSLDREVGFLCLSRTWKSLPMWAHYADKFTGAVIEFDGNHDFFEWAFDIHYSHDRPIRDLALYWREEIPITEMCDKSVEWEYEKEVRLARCLSDCDLIKVDSGVPIYVADIPLACIKGVILGERFNQSEMIGVFRMIKDTEITGDWAYLDHWSYNLELRPFKLSYPSGGKMASSIVFRNYRDFPNL